MGQIAVGQVILTRVYDPRYPDNVCDVVPEAVTYKGTNKPVLHKCQFSWWCDGQKDEPDFDSKEIAPFSPTTCLDFNIRER